MAAAGNPLDRLREQRAARLLELLQSDLRAQVRVEQDAARGERRDRRARRQARIARLEDPAERQRLWTRDTLPSFEGVPIRSLSKARAFWEEVDVTTWTKVELDAACALLDLPTKGRKRDLLARIQDWVLEPELTAERQRQKQRSHEFDAMLATGRVFAFGSNCHGQLGLGHRNACKMPTEIESFRGMRVTQVESGFEADFTFAIAEDGRVFAWGGGGKAFFSRHSTKSVAVMPVSTNTIPVADNPSQDLLEDADTKSASKPHASSNLPLTTNCFLLPQELPGLSAMSIRKISCGRSGGHIALMTSFDQCYIWGTGEYGENGVEVPTPAHLQLQHVQTLGTRPARVISVSVGNAHTTAVAKDGKLFAWGGNWSGQLGVGALRRGGVHDKRLRFCFPAPTAVESLNGTKVLRVSCGAAHTGVVSADGNLYMFGCGDGGRLGLGSNDDATSPQLVTALADMVVLDVCCGSWHSLCLATQRHSSHRAPVISASPTKKKSRTAELRLDDDEGGYVYSFGSGLQGQLGLGKQKTAALPTCIPALQLRRVRCRSIATSSLHCCALSTDGFLYTWGDNTNGCLGRSGSSNNGGSGSFAEFSEPDAIDPESYRGYGVGPIVSVAVGRSFTVFATGPLARNDESRRDEFQQRGQLNALDRALGSATSKLSRWRL